MVFALLIAAIIWNLGTWSFGLPASSSHTLIGSVIGVGIANALLHGRSGTSGVDWTQATSIGKALLLSPMFGFGLAAILLLVVKFVIPSKELFAEPKGDQPPPPWIRGILVLTCTLVSFFHGSNDGQKGMGLIMLILIGTVPTTYALNRAMPVSQIEKFEANSQAASAVIGAKAAGYNVLGDPRAAVTAYVAQHQINEGTYPSLAVLVSDIGKQVTQYGSIAKMPTDQVGNTRNDIYLASEAIRFLVKDKENDLNAQDVATLNAYKGSLDSATKFIPGWVKIVVAIALGLGTMVGWKRIVVTVGEKIGKTHLTYAQGACAEITAAATIAAADGYGLPVSTTHVLSSGIAGTMAANGSGLQWSTIRNIALAWVLTLPAAMLLVRHALLHLLARVLSFERASKHPLGARKNPGALRRRGFASALRYRTTRHATELRGTPQKLRHRIPIRVDRICAAPRGIRRRRANYGRQASRRNATGPSKSCLRNGRRVLRRPVGTAQAQPDPSRWRRWRKGPTKYMRLRVASSSVVPLVGLMGLDNR